jgi:hypothetical protein
MITSGQKFIDESPNAWTLPSSTRRFCQEGENKGMPGVCPLPGKGGTAGPAKAKAAKPAKSPHVFPDGKPRMSNLYPSDDKLPELTATVANLTPEQKGAVNAYSGGYYRALNQSLRTGAPLSPQSQQVYDGVRSAIAAAPPLKDAVTAWRGVKLEGDQARQFMAGMEGALKSKQPVEMKGLISTSLSPGTAADFGSVVMEVRATHGIYVNPVSTVKGERELILDHGTKFKVVGIKDIPFGGGGNKRKVVQLEQIMPEKEQAQTHAESDSQGPIDPAAPAGDNKGRFAADSLDGFVFPPDQSQEGAG